MNKNHKGFASIILIIMVIALAGVLGYITLAKKSPTPSAIERQQQVTQPTVNNNSPQTLPPSETTNWKTYRNEKYGFELKYPPTWDPEVNPNSGNLSFAVLNAVFGFVDVQEMSLESAIAPYTEIPKYLDKFDILVPLSDLSSSRYIGKKMAFREKNSDETHFVYILKIGSNTLVISMGYEEENQVYGRKDRDGRIISKSYFENAISLFEEVNFR